MFYNMQSNTETKNHMDL